MVKDTIRDLTNKYLSFKTSPIEIRLDVLQRYLRRINEPNRTRLTKSVFSAICLSICVLFVFASSNLILQTSLGEETNDALYHEIHGIKDNTMLQGPDPDEITCADISNTASKTGATALTNDRNQTFEQMGQDTPFGQTLADDDSPPEETVKLIFIHHSCGENWLSDGNGGLGIALRDNNYYVSDTNYGWGPDFIGDRTDIGDWWTWFRGPDSETYLTALYDESDSHSYYSRMETDPGGRNEIVMFKSCYPNSALQGDPDDPVPDIESNPLKGESSGSEYHTVANAKGIYIDLLSYMETRQDVLFLIVTAPPLSDGTYAANIRAFNQWLVYDWLDGYPHQNVFVLDFYNVLTTNKGSVNVNDLNEETGNHHRIWDGAVQHQYDGVHNTLAYRSGDDHPNQVGNLKATAELVPLINVAYNRWKEGAPLPPSKPTTPEGPDSGLTDESYEYTTSSTDPSESQLKYTFSWGDGTTTTTEFHESGDEANATHSWENAGSYQVRAKATNEEDTSSSWSNPLGVTIEEPNHTPSTPSLPAGSYTVKKGKTYTYSATSTDPDGDQVKMIFDWGDGTHDETVLVKSGKKVKAAHVWLTSGRYDLRIKAIDEHGAESDWSKVVTVINKPPSKPSTPAGPSKGYVDTEYSYTTKTKDPEKDQIVIKVDWGDGVVEESDHVESGEKVTLTHTWDAPGTYSVKVMAIDIEGDESDWSRAKKVKIS